MLLPIGDENRRASRPAWVTYLLIAANFAVFFFLQQGGLNEAFTYGWSVVPLEITTGTDLTAPRPITVGGQTVERSEEHTSELQSRGHLVCRLLLEKKKNK